MASPFSYQPPPGVSQYNPVAYQTRYDYVDPWMYAPPTSEKGARGAILIAVLYVLGNTPIITFLL